MGSLESDTTERLHFHFSLSCIGEGNGNPLQCSCLEHPRDRGAWWAAVSGVAQSWTWLKWLSSSSIYLHSFIQPVVLFPFGCEACGILVPWPGIESRSLAVIAWTTKELPDLWFLKAAVHPVLHGVPEMPLLWAVSFQNRQEIPELSFRRFFLFVNTM